MSEHKIETPFGVLTVTVYPGHRPQVSLVLEADPGDDFRLDRIELEERRLDVTIEGKWS